jgi:hypothetical protein
MLAVVDSDRRTRCRGISCRPAMVMEIAAAEVRWPRWDQRTARDNSGARVAHQSWQISGDSRRNCRRFGCGHLVIRCDCSLSRRGETARCRRRVSGARRVDSRPSLSMSVTSWVPPLMTFGRTAVASPAQPGSSAEALPAQRYRSPIPILRLDGRFELIAKLKGLSRARGGALHRPSYGRIKAAACFREIRLRTVGRSKTWRNVRF